MPEMLNIASSMSESNKYLGETNYILTESSTMKDVFDTVGSISETTKYNKNKLYNIMNNKTDITVEESDGLISLIDKMEDINVNYWKFPQWISNTGFYFYATNLNANYQYNCIANKDEYIHSFGGSSTRTSHIRYNTKLDSYDTMPSIPYDFYEGSIAYDENFAYLFGGSTSRTNNYQYDFLLTTYTQNPNLTITNGMYSTTSRALYHKNDIYLFNHSGIYDKYDPITQTYTRLSTTNIPTIFGCCSVGDSIYLAGSSTNLRCLDTTTNTITNLANYTSGFIPYHIFYHKGKIYSPNGNTSSSYSRNDISIYNIDTNTHTYSANEFPTYMHYYGGISVFGDITYILGGSGQANRTLCYKIREI